MIPDTAGRKEAVLLIHPGGLGDLCLSESAILSLARHFGPCIEAVGSTRLLALFREYFSDIHSLDRREWAYLFSPDIAGPRWDGIVFMGKDTSGSIRTRLAVLTEALLFLDLFPDHTGMGVEEYQLAQLRERGIEPQRKESAVVGSERLVLYPEAMYRKKKWPIERFLHLYDLLKAEGREIIIMRPQELELPGTAGPAFESLTNAAQFLSGGGIFFSNDSGMAHFAARCGMRPLTLFPDADPVIWQPKNSLALDCRHRQPPTADEAACFICFGMQNPTAQGIWKGA